MSKQSRRNFLKLAGVTAATVVTGTAMASENPFSFKPVEASTQQVAMEGNCGSSMKKADDDKEEGKETEMKEGQCGANMKKEGDHMKEGQCGANMKKGGDHMKEGQCGASMMRKGA